MGDTAFCRIAFNTAFIPDNNSLVFTKYNISPYGFHKDNRFPADFFI